MYILRNLYAAITYTVTAYNVTAYTYTELFQRLTKNFALEAI